MYGLDGGCRSSSSGHDTAVHDSLRNSDLVRQVACLALKPTSGRTERLVAVRIMEAVRRTHLMALIAVEAA